MPGQSFQHSAETPADVGSVWATFDDPATWGAIPGVDRVIDPVIDAQGRLQRFSFETLVAGRKYRGKAVSGAREEERLIAWDIDSSEIEGKITVKLEPTQSGTRVDVRLHANGTGMLSAVFFPVIAAAIGNGFPETVKEFVAGLSP